MADVRRIMGVGLLVAVVGGVPAAMPAAAGDPGPGERIAFASDRFADGGEPVPETETETDIVLMGTDGSDPTRFTYDPGRAVEPAWSPDGTRIAYNASSLAATSFDGDFAFALGDIVVFDGVTRTTDRSADHRSPSDPSAPSVAYGHPTWSPDGTAIAYRADRTDGGTPAGGPEYSLVEAAPLGGAGSVIDDPRPAVPFPAQEAPAWSPDGARIAFHDDAAIVIAEADASSSDQLVPDGTEPAWSPDGEQIAYVAPGVEGANDIFLIDADGGSPVNLTNLPGDDGDPVWSPDGSQIAFETDRDGNWEIYVMGADGSAPTNLTNHAAVDVDPDWSGPCPDGCGDLLEPTSPPGVPTIVGIDSIGAQQYLHFDPATTGPPAHRFTIEFAPTGPTVTATFSPVPVPELAEGVTYEITIRAENQVGSSPASSPFEHHVPCAVDQDNTFVDVDPWADHAVSWLVHHGYATGYPGNRFRPLAPATRAEVARMLYRIADPDPPPDETGSPFPDVPAWVDLPVSWLYDEGLVDGFPDGGFHPDEPMTRGQITRILFRSAGIDDPEELPEHGLTGVPAWVETAVRWIVDAGIAHGYPDMTYRADLPILRGQLANMLYRLAGCAGG